MPGLTTYQVDRLRDFVLLAEEMATSDPEMPTYEDTDERFWRVLGEVKKILGIKSDE